MLWYNSVFHLSRMAGDHAILADIALPVRTGHVAEYPVGGCIAETLTGLAKMVFIFVVNLLVIQAWFPPLFSYWNRHGSRSISVEVFCHLLLSLMTLHLVKLSRAGLIRVMLFCSLLTVKVSLATCLYPSYGLPIFYAMPIFRLPEFIIGGGICLLIKDLASTRTCWGAQVPAMILVVCYLGSCGEYLFIGVVHDWVVALAMTFYIKSFH